MKNNLEIGRALRDRPAGAPSHDTDLISRKDAIQTLWDIIPEEMRGGGLNPMIPIKDIVEALGELPAAPPAWSPGLHVQQFGRAIRKKSVLAGFENP